MATTTNKVAQTLARATIAARLLHAAPVNNIASTTAARAATATAASAALGQAVPHKLAVLQTAEHRQHTNAAHSTAAVVSAAAVLLACSAAQRDIDDIDSKAQCEGTLVNHRLRASARDTRGHYALLNEIGRGGFSVVRLAVDMNTDELLAAKIFDPKSCSMQDIQNEIAMLRYLGKHQHIVSLHDVLSAPNETIMLTDLVQGGELFDYIVDMGSVSEKDASRLLRDACRALEYMHACGVCHRDVKPENLLLTNHSADADIKIADFGLSRRLRNGEKVLEEHPSGTVAYWAPEIIKHQPQDFGVDMWAFGVLAYITLTGVHPFDPRGDRSDAEIVREVANGSYDVTNPWYGDLSVEAKDFLSKLLCADPTKRLSATDALAHAWLKGATTLSAEPLCDGHADRLVAYQRLQLLRANILAVVMSTQHTKFEMSGGPPAATGTGSNGSATRATTTNMDLFRDTFALFDKDESGFIDHDELEGVMLALGQRLSRSELDAIMRHADVDGDGKISFMEFASVMNQRLFRLGELTEADLKAAFNIYDTNHDGFISSSELEYMLHLLGKRKFTSHEIASMLDAADSNRDGQIDYSEFCQLMQKSLASATSVSSK